MARLIKWFFKSSCQIWNDRSWCWCSCWSWRSCWNCCSSCWGSWCWCSRRSCRRSVSNICGLWSIPSNSIPLLPSFFHFKIFCSNPLTLIVFVIVRKFLNLKNKIVPFTMPLKKYSNCLKSGRPGRFWNAFGCWIVRISNNVWKPNIYDVSILSYIWNLDAFLSGLANRTSGFRRSTVN